VLLSIHGTLDVLAICSIGFLPAAAALLFLADACLVSALPLLRFCSAGLLPFAVTDSLQ
jgi:hypothetical protein